MYKATTMVCEDYRDKQSGERVDLTLNISFGCFAIESEAKDVSASADVKVELVNDVKMIVIHTKVGDYFVKQDDIVFQRIKDEKIAKMGVPLDPKNPDALKIIMESLDPQSEYHQKYMIEEDDLEVIEYSLEYFLEHFRVGFNLQNVAYGWEEVA